MVESGGGGWCKGGNGGDIGMMVVATYGDCGHDGGGGWVGGVGGEGLVMVEKEKWLWL